MPPTFILGVLIFLVAVSHGTAQTSIPDLQREGKAHADSAAAYVERLHLVPPGYQWRNVREAVRDVRRERRANKRAESVQADVRDGAWFEMGSINQAGRVLCTAFDSVTNRVWVAGAGGTIWQGDIEGYDWKCLNDFRQIDYPRHLQYIRLSDGTDRVLAASRDGHMWYRDGEGEWQESQGLTEIQRAGYLEKAVRSVRNGQITTYVAGMEVDRDRSLSWMVCYESRDSGKSFQKIFQRNNLYSFIDIWSNGYDKVVLSLNDTVYSIDAESRIAPITTVPSNAGGYFRGRIVMNSTGQLFAIREWTPTDIYSYDVATGWVKTTEMNSRPFDNRSFHTSLTDPNMILLGAVELHRSGNQGYDFTIVNTWGEYYGNPEAKLHADIPAIESYFLSDGREVMFICTDGGLYVSYDKCATVKNISTYGLNVSQYYSVYTSRDNVNVIYAGSQDQGFQRSRIEEGGPRDFEQTISGDYANIVSTDEGHTLWTVYPGFVMYIPDAEDSWRPVLQTFPHSKHLWLPPLVAHPTDPSRVFLGGGSSIGSLKGGYIYEYRAAGNIIYVDSIRHDFGEGTFANSIMALAIAKSDPSVMYAITEDLYFWKSLEDRDYWTRRARVGGGHYFAGHTISVDPDDADVVYVGGSGYASSGVVHSTNGGVSFTPIDGLPPCLVLDLALSSDKSRLYAATDVGAFVYDFTTTTWTDLTELGGPDQEYWSVDYIPALKTARFGTYGRGIWDYREVISDVTVDSPQALTMLNVSSTLTPSGPRIVVELGQGAEGATARWYDVNGRLITTTTYTTNEPTFTITDIPDGSPVMVVITTPRGVGGTVIAR
ncbi:MAG TPA: hypothetical protein PLW14_13500 [Chlorobiota bacterium]|nr:hypothetical protein [Chlorobiota bacterium]